MKYYLGELYVTHRKFFGFWKPFTHKLSLTLITAYSWDEAQDKVVKWADQRMAEMGKPEKWKYKAFATPAI